MEELKLYSKRKIQNIYENKLAHAIRNNITVYQGIMIRDSEYIGKEEEYLTLYFPTSIKEKTITLLSTILQEDISPRILHSSIDYYHGLWNPDLLSITYDEFLTLYNHLVIKDKNNFITSIDKLYYKDKYTYIHGYCNVDIPKELKQFCLDMECTLYKKTCAILTKYFFSVNKDINKAALYIVSRNEKESKKEFKTITQSLQNQFALTDPISYSPGNDPFYKSQILVNQFDFDLNYLYTIGAYLKLTEHICN